MIEYYKNLSLENLPYINEEGLVCWEEFKDVPEYEGLYQVSDLGRVKSLARTITRSNGILENKSEKILKQSDNGKGYLNIRFVNNYTEARKYTHRVVLETFQGKCKYPVDHKNHIRSCNILSNLRYCTQRENSTGNKKEPFSKHTGVIYSHNKFKRFGAVIKIKGVSYYLGGFELEKEASDAYQTALYNLENFSITPKGEVVNIDDNAIFKTKSIGVISKNRKIVLDTSSGIYYDSLKQACESLGYNYRIISSMLSETGRHRTNKTSLIYI